MADKIVRFYMYNGRGDVVGQTDSSGTPTYQAAYLAFGQHPTESGFTLDRQKASTKEQDPTGLLNEGFRYRDPDTGTFLTRDPLGFKAGPNMYTYVRQNPWTRFDPEGLQTTNTTPPPPQDLTFWGFLKLLRDQADTPMGRAASFYNDLQEGTKPPPSGDGDNRRPFPF